jgi:CheY-like chemotaxis protein
MATEKAQHRHVLVVEDDASMRELLRLHLSNAGYRVTAAEDAALAGRELLVAPPDLILADIQLPYMSGLELASILMADATLPNIPVVLISAHEHYRDRAEAIGAVFLLKPILKEKLLEAIAKALQWKEEAPGPGPSEPIRWVTRETVRQATLRRARDLAGGVSFLGRKLGIGVNALDAMIHGNQDTPQSIFLQAAEFVADAETSRATPPGFPENWESAEWISRTAAC